MKQELVIKKGRPTELKAYAHHTQDIGMMQVPIGPWKVEIRFDKDQLMEITMNLTEAQWASLYKEMQRKTEMEIVLRWEGSNEGQV